ncbi:MAG TPA: hypothetical protein VEF71_07155 [Streptosporangiaceae bacterium]|nr:hypothetical protein [Streptosporangiaceae bacterium]
MSEDPQPGATPETPASPDASHDAVLPARSRVSGMVVGHLADQARQMAQAARAGRVASTDAEPGVRDLTPLRDLLAELIEELQRVRPRERIGRALRQAADVIDPPPPLS